MAVRGDLSAPAPQPVARDMAGSARSGATAFKADTSAPLGGAPLAPTATPAASVERVATRGSRRKPVLLALLALVACIGAYFAYGWWSNGRFMVSTDDAYVAADVTILAAKATGYVTAVEVANNQQVAQGQVLLRIDDTDYRLAVDAANGKVATQNATVDRIKRQIEAAQAQVQQAEPQIVAARADVVRTSADYERQTRLSQSDFASRARLEQALADRDRASAAQKGSEAGLVAARANVAVLVAQQEEAERVAAEYRTAAAKAERDLSFTVVRAPVAGVVGNRAVEVGAFVQAGTRLTALVPLSSVHVDANFKETQLARVRPGLRVVLEVDAFPGRDIGGTVESIAPASGAQFSLLPPENATGNFTKIVQRVPVRIQIDPVVAEEGVLRPGMSVVARVDTRERPAAPAQAALRP